MICHLKYNIDKKKYKKVFFDNYSKGKFYNLNGVDVPYWWRIYGLEKEVIEVTRDLGIQDLNFKAVFTFQHQFSKLPDHVDIDRIVGLNLNLADDMPNITIEKKLYEYEAALIDVGSKVHSVTADKKPRLVLKYTFTDDWSKIYEVLNKNNIIDHEKTIKDNPEYKNYISILTEENKKFLKEPNKLLKNT